MIVSLGVFFNVLQIIGLVRVGYHTQACIIYVSQILLGNSCSAKEQIYVPRAKE